MTEADLERKVEHLDEKLERQYHNFGMDNARRLGYMYSFAKFLVGTAIAGTIFAYATRWEPIDNYMHNHTPNAVVNRDTYIRTFEHYGMKAFRTVVIGAAHTYEDVTKTVTEMKEQSKQTQELYDKNKELAALRKMLEEKEEKKQEEK